MKVTDILRVKGNTLYTVSPDESLGEAMKTMAEHDIGSLVVMDHGKLVGMLTFREVIQVLVASNGSLGLALVGAAMEPDPLVCTPETDLDEVRRQWRGPLLGLAKSGVDISSIIQQVISGGVGGGALIAIAGLLKGMTANKG